MPELKSFVQTLTIFVLIWSFLPLFTSRWLFLLLVRLFQCPQAVEMLPRSWLDICILLSILGVRGILLFSFPIKQSKSSIFGEINWELQMEFCFGQLLLSLPKSCLQMPRRQAVAGFYSRFWFSLSQKLVCGRVPKVLYLEGTCCNKLCPCSVSQSLSWPKCRL